MYNALLVANHIVKYCNSKNHPISNLKLQKLLYFVQAEFLVSKGIPCFREAIEAYGEIYLDGGFASYDESNGYIPAMEALKELDVYTIEDGRFRRITELRIVDDSDEGDFQIDADE